ncbi:MAG: ribonuclease P protein component [Endomicrobium sp.]|jgi:ribonuclease P protein component|nr:ribonuclease P protein component [Endomicrobium sp.]
MQNSKKCLENLSFKQSENNKLFTLTYSERLHIQKDFNKVFKNGLKLENKKIKILAYKRNDGNSLRRLGLVTSRKVGNAVIRNRTKRRLREIFRTNKYLLEPSLDLIFISKPETSLLNYSDLKKVVLVLLKNAKLYMGQD